MSRILFITSNRLGDAVLSTGLLDHLTRAYPDARLTIACGPLPAPLFRSVPGLERLIPLAKRSYARHWLRLWLECVGTRWDLVLDLRNSAVGRLVPARRRVFHAKPPRPMHKVEENAALLGLSPPPAPRLWIDDAARRQADALIPAGTGPFLAIGPTANWLGKEWPADRFARLALRLTGEGGALAGARVAVLAAGPERERAKPVLDALGDRAIDLTGRTDPMAAAACLERASLYVGNDSGLMHIAAAAGVPTVGLFGPGYPAVYGPWGPQGRVVVSEVPQADLLARVAADPKDYGLMDGIAEERVAQVAASLLAESKGPCDQFAVNPDSVAELPPLR
ncbi:glycosyltransferase family 9 protein (plasmid) [Azospirillum humicireducens]|uniref:Glycosyltransferase family 9 protein n=1 Tax=Azospirillum humicireducens TaxID=1226968 RepID=A0A2R4VWP4_9PROT|nr:glycosyltransferase family 9 protein [Azospirillum humicireducens]AWB08854.1 glycosyltransferase family 9 protein [Azospirillum humicireducens]